MLSRISRHSSLSRSWLSDRPARGFSVTLELCFRCNVRCVFCSRWSDPTDLSLDVIRTIAADMAELGAGYVSLSGGDPFVRRDIHEVIDAFAERRVPLHINTNGALLKSHAEFLRARATAIRGVTVSLDSPEAAVHDEIRGISGTFRRAMEGIESIRDAVPVSLACTLNQKNLDEIEAYDRFAKSHRLPYRFQPLHDDGDNGLAPNQDGVTVEDDALNGLTARLEATVEHGDGADKRLFYRLFEPFLRDRKGLETLRCTAAARLIYFVSPEGDVFPCDTRRDKPLGNVYRERFRDVVTGAAATGWRATCRKRENGCTCMYACVAPANLLYQDLPLRPLSRSGWPLRGRCCSSPTATTGP